MPEDHPDVELVGAAMREEWRAEQEAATRDAADDWHHRKTLNELFVEHMHRGDRLAVMAAGHRITGTVEELGADLVALRTLFGRVDIHLTPAVPLWFELFERSTDGGHRGSDVAGGSFRRALQLRESDELVTLGTLFDTDGVDGKLRVGADFVTVTARMGAETVIPMHCVSWVSPHRS